MLYTWRIYSWFMTYLLMIYFLPSSADQIKRLHTVSPYVCMKLEEN